ncbi:DNA-processing protein DprA [Selenomonadales bacterium OttesenSCG-928-I06]|nr:DNA-processing protein DprA [Selenomonadales bacterium OttesenSCG-928-I06]
MEKLHLAALQTVPGIGSAKIKILLEYFGSAKKAWHADSAELLSKSILNEKVLSDFLAYRAKINVNKIAEEWYNKKINILTIYDKEYPSLLKHIKNPPYVLFYKGTCLNFDKTIAIVGSRKASDYGKNATKLLASQLAEAGVCVVSGAARGIDTASHEGALKAGATIAVLGCGVDIAYPPENKNLLEAIAEKGAIVSEYAPGTPPFSMNFPIRNRIISGLSRGVVVVEAGKKSGSLITADFALESGRDVFAIPGNIFSQISQGTNNLIKMGAKLIDNVEGILEEYNWDMPSKEKKENFLDNKDVNNEVFTDVNREKINFDEPKNAIEEKLDLNEEEEKVYNILANNPVSIEEIVLKTGLALGKISYILLQLTIRGIATELSDRSYIRNSRG